MEAAANIPEELPRFSACDDIKYLGSNDSAIQFLVSIVFVVRSALIISLQRKEAHWLNLVEGFRTPRGILSNDLRGEQWSDSISPGWTQFVPLISGAVGALNRNSLPPTGVRSAPTAVFVETQ